MIGDAPTRRVQSVETAFRIVGVIQERGGATLAEVADEVDLAKSTVHNYLGTLETMGYVVDESGTYRPGLRFLTHGMAAKHSVDASEAVAQALDDLASDLDVPVWWLVAELGRGIFVDAGLPDDREAVYGRVGKRSHLHTTAPGKAILAHLPDADLERVLDRHGLPVHTNRTTTDVDALRSELDRIREQGYAVSDGEAALGVQSIGVAFEGPSGTVHALGVFGHSHDVGGQAVAEEVAARLMGAADDVETAMAERQG